MFHKVKSVTPLSDYVLLIHFADGCAKRYDVKPLMTMFEPFQGLTKHGLFDCVSVDSGGYGISWNESIDLSCDELWKNGIGVYTPFDSLIAFSDATDIWGLNESTLRKAVAYKKLVEGIDVKKFGKQWVVTKEAMKREYGDPGTALP